MIDASKPRVVVAGMGYVGLPIAIMLARAGHDVVGFDTNAQVVEDVNAGIMPHVSEQQLQALLATPEVREHLQAQGAPGPADAFIVAVPTPLEERRKRADLAAVTAALEMIAPHLRAGNLVVVESTVPPNTCRGVVAPLLERLTGLQAGRDYRLAHCPERILPGDVFYEIVHNDRVIGGIDADSSAAAAELYGSFVKGEIFLTDDLTAEMVKLMENSYRDVNIAFANELRAVCEGLGVDVEAAVGLANKHPRVNILAPGIGVGGHCLPIDPWFIHEVDPEHSRMIETAREINDGVPALISAKIRRAVAGIERPRIVAIGMTYKPDTYDLRNSPAMEVVRLLREDGYDVAQFDPLVPGHGYASLVEAAHGADLLAVLVEHRAVAVELSDTRPAIEGAMRRATVLRF